MASLLGLVCAVCAGCAPDGGGAPSPQTHLPPTGPGRLLPQADIDLLAAALPDAFEAMHWGRLHVTDQVTALHAAALTPDDRLVDVRARRAAEGGVEVRVRIGYFGDERLEDRFLDALERHAAQHRRRAERSMEH